MAPSSIGGGGSGADRYSTGDLRAIGFQGVSQHGALESTLKDLFVWVESFATESINWYSQEKVSKARWSRFLRLASVLLFSLGTVTPVVAVGMGWSKQSIWGYGLIGLGACCVAVDRVCGFSSSWMRYVSTAISLNRRLIAFQASWPRIEARVTGNPDVDEFSKAVQELVTFVDDFAMLMETETLAWVSEFQNHLLQLESGTVPALPSRSQ
ncbi:SLATT domain-containing protein [Streptomyces sp. NPDC051913]|uniref:SLATT domain-containing protein n=1 Tax=Streptomyces sp. NPDC051913 TaxID=3365676 RepID=UPI0037D559C5